MLAVCTSSLKDERSQKEMESCFTINDGDDFADFSGGNLLDAIDFDDLFVGINDGDVLPDLEMDSEILAEFSLSGGEESSEIVNTNNTSSFDNSSSNNNNNNNEEDNNWRKYDEVEKAAAAADSSGDVVAGLVMDTKKTSRKESSGDDQKARKKSSSANQSKNAQPAAAAAAATKRKVKVDWTPELHRRFVQAVEQLGVDKAVPSRILDIMGIDCLTRHNIASHLQKYRSHRKHLLAREAEAASWNQRRQMYGGGAAAAIPPTIGFPPVAPMPPHFRPLHVWGHPSADQSLMHLWPKLLGPSRPPAAAAPPAWATLPPPADPSFWHSHHQRAPNSLSPGTPCFVPPLAAARFPTPTEPCIPSSTTIYKADPGMGVPTLPVGQTLPKPPVDFQPSKESVDAAIGDVLSKPWLPLPLRLKPPSVDSVLVELQRQGISKVPPTTSL